MSEYQGKKITEQHTEWFIDWMAQVYKDAMLHGYKHGWDDAKEHFSPKRDL